MARCRNCFQEAEAKRDLCKNCQTSGRDEVTPGNLLTGSEGWVAKKKIRKNPDGTVTVILPSSLNSNDNPEITGEEFRE